MFLTQTLDSCFTQFSCAEDLRKNHAVIESFILAVRKQDYHFSRPDFEIPLVLHGLLLRLSAVTSEGDATIYLKRVRCVLTNAKLTASSGAQLFYWLNCCMVFIRLAKLVEYMDICYRMLAYCLLCFNYDKLNGKLI